MSILNISVITPVYNAEKYLRKSVESALQFEEVKEVILIEDGSKDQSLKVCKELIQQYDRVKLFQHPNGINKGAGASRNLGIENSKQEYIAFLDADDYYLANRFDAEKKIFIENSNADGVYGALGIHFYSDKAKKILLDTNLSRNENDGDNEFLFTVGVNIAPNELFDRWIGIGKPLSKFSIDCLTIKAKTLKTLPYYFNVNLRLHQDTDFIIRLSYYFKLYPGIIDKEIGIRGVHEHNRITTIKKNTKKFYYNKYKLHKSLYHWAKETSLPKKYISYLEYKKNSLYLQSILPLEKVKLLLLKLTGKKNIPSLLYKTVLKK